MWINIRILSLLINFTNFSKDYTIFFVVSEGPISVPGPNQPPIKCVRGAL